MEIGKMFEVATRKRLRFNFRGQISVEDLWDLSVENLDSIYRNLKKEEKKEQEESLLKTRTAADQELDIQIELVKYIVETKLAEQKARVDAKEKKAQKDKILSIIAEKKDAALKDMNVEDLEKMVKDL